MRENLHEFRGVTKVNNNDGETLRESFSEQRLSEGIVSLYLSEYFTGWNMKNTKMISVVFEVHMWRSSFFKKTSVTALKEYES